jgi:hypothetical protein
LRAHCGAIAAGVQQHRFGHAARARAGRDPDRSDRLGGRAAIGPGDAGDGNREVRRRARERALGHRPGDLRTDRPVRFDQRRRHAEQVALGGVRIRDDAALEPGARAGARGARGGDQAAGARFGSGDGCAPRDERRSDAGDERIDQLLLAHTNRHTAITSSVHSAATTSSNRMPNLAPSRSARCAGP